MVVQRNADWLYLADTIHQNIPRLVLIPILKIVDISSKQFTMIGRPL